MFFQAVEDRILKRLENADAAKLKPFAAKLRGTAEALTRDKFIHTILVTAWLTELVIHLYEARALQQISQQKRIWISNANTQGINQTSRQGPAEMYYLQYRDSVLAEGFEEFGIELPAHLTSQNKKT